ncbi:MAG: hypothetical protein QG635_372 [Bacteroidota bacterium]|nr:hypothetical protein [Bacteroidota bacterium]
MKIHWSSHFIKQVKKAVKHEPALATKIENTVDLLAKNPFNPRLNTHKLKGFLEESWSCSVDYYNRIIFDFISNSETQENEILLLSFGTHDEVY